MQEITPNNETSPTFKDKNDIELKGNCRAVKFVRLLSREFARGGGPLCLMLLTGPGLFGGLYTTSATSPSAEVCFGLLCGGVVEVTAYISAACTFPPRLRGWYPRQQPRPPVQYDTQFFTVKVNFHPERSLSNLLFSPFTNCAFISPLLAPFSPFFAFTRELSSLL